MCQPIYYRDANGALLVYDITDRDSFTKVRLRLNRRASLHARACVSNLVSDAASGRSSSCCVCCRCVTG
jgi:GTPase SAR1 family protein